MREGYYWELPDGEKQNRCPRVHIKEDPEWWGELMTAYHAFEKGFLPASGGTDNQPALFMPTMHVINSAIDDETQRERELKDKQDEAIARQRQQAGGGGYAPLRPGSKR